MFELIPTTETNIEFVNKLNILLSEKFSIIGRVLKEITHKSTKGQRKDSLIFNQEAARKIAEIKDPFIKYISRSIYDNYNDIINGIIFRIHMNELFTEDFIMSLMKELIPKVQELHNEKQKIEEKYRKEWSLICRKGEKFESFSFSRRRPGNVLNNPEFFRIYEQFKNKVKSEHPRVRDLEVYIENNYDYRKQKEEIIEKFLQTIPEYIEHKKEISIHFENSSKDKKIIEDQIKTEINNFDFNILKPAITKLIQEFIKIITNSIITKTI